MKKTRKVLSLVLAIVVAFGSMPLVYTGTAAADAVTYSASGTGTIDDPTRPVEASGALNYTDLYKMNINSQSASYTFYQTMNDEYFTFGQTQGLQNFYESSVGSRTLTFRGISFYEGSSGMNGSTEPEEIAPGSGMWESPLITTNPTSEFLDKYWVKNTWSSTNDNASGKNIDLRNGDVALVLDGSFWDFGGCRVYTWQDDIVFHGHSASESGEINTGYYEQLKWDWYNDDGASADFDLRIGTTIRVLDARELAREIAEAEYILNNPDDYTEKYLASVEATLNTIPEDLRDFSKVYDQSVIDSYTQMMVDISLNSADYREYNQVYKSLMTINNSRGAFTEKSFSAFKAEIEDINRNLPKNLDKTQQETVNRATQALRDAYDKLVATDVSNSDSGYTYNGQKDQGYMNFVVDNTAFKFMQTKDNQVFQYNQMWTVTKYDGDTDRHCGGIILQSASLANACSNSTCCDSSTVPAQNNTDAYVARLTNGSVAYRENIKNEIGAIGGNSNTTFSASEFLCWNEYTDASGTVPQETTIIDTTGELTGALDSNRDYVIPGRTNKSYYLTNSPSFVGNDENTFGEINLQYVLRAGWSYLTGGLSGIGINLGATKNSRHIHVNNTIQVTDVRQLISAVAQAEEVLANPGSHSENYITALQAAVDSVPVEMLRGVEYYTQQQVDKLYNDIITIPEQVADYSEFVEVFEMMIALNKDKYTVDSYNTFIDEIYAINHGLAKNLTADNQATVNAAVDALYAAYNKLVSAHLNEDNVFTQDDIAETGNSPLEFSVSSTKYNFMQTVDGQKFAIRTEITARNTKARYTCSLLALRFSTATAETIESICQGRSDPDTGCHNGENILINQSELVLSGVTGVNTYTANDAGDVGEHNTWVNTEGVALSTNGIFNDPSTLSTSDSSAYAEMYYTGVSGNQESFNAQIDANIALRLGWSYHETVLGIAGESIRRHAHIPVSIQITDVRALHSLYTEVEEILSGETETSYTLGSLLNLYYAYVATNEDIANGDIYVTQETANAEYAKLKAAYDELQAGADYGEYFDAYVKAQEIISTNNDDGYDNKLYDEETFNTFVETVETINSGLDRNLADTSENQAIIDAATGSLNGAIITLEATKRADYTELEELIAKAEKITNAYEGTYTNETLDVLKEALNNANALDRELPASEQATVDAITSALEAAVEDMEFRADYSEFEEAYNKIQDIVNAPEGTYTEETVQAAKDALTQADNLNKDLPDTAENRITIENAANELNKVLNGVQEKADYSDFEEALEDAKEIVNAPEGTYTDETVKNAQDAIDAAEALDKDLADTEENRQTIKDVTDALEEAVTNAQEKADYTDYNAAKEAVDNLVNDDGNGNPIYDEEAFQEYKDKVAEIDNALDKNLPKSEENQAVIDKATQDLEDLKATLEESRIATPTVIDPETTVDEILDEVLKDYNPDEVIVEFKNYLGEELTSADFVGTGSILKVTLKSTGEVLEYKMFIVMGDVDGDSDVDADDYQQSVNVGLEFETYAEEHYYFFIANDMDADGVIDVIDAAIIRGMY